MSKDRWIISVGMISEGTDSPRLQVCCHLSRIRTELHFRQVLGRILRSQAGEPPEVGGWLYVLAESSLTEFARRISDDLPEQSVVSFSPISSKQNLDATSEYAVFAEDDEATEWGFSIDATGSRISGPEQAAQKETTELSMSNHYWSEILSLFEDRIV